MGDHVEDNGQDTAPDLAVADALAQLYDALGRSLPYATWRGAYPSEADAWADLVGEVRALADLTVIRLDRPDGYPSVWLVEPTPGDGWVTTDLARAAPHRWVTFEWPTLAFLRGLVEHVTEQLDQLALDRERARMNGLDAPLAAPVIDTDRRYR